jgi:hypothetical protein
MERCRILGLVTAAGLVQHVIQPVSYIAEHVSYLDASEMVFRFWHGARWIKGRVHSCTGQ